MTVSSVSRLSDEALRRGLRDLVAHDRATTVRLLIHLAEFDARRLYREDGFDCMKSYCLGELGMSEDIAYKRICVARRARRFPSIFVSLADGTLTLTGVAMLSRYLTEANAAELLTAAAGRTNARIAELIAERFPQPDLPTLLQPLAPPPTSVPVPAASAPALSIEPNCQALAVRRVEPPVAVPLPPARVTPLAPQRHGVQFTIGQSDLELLRRAQDLLDHQLPSRDEGEIFVRALRAYVSQLEKRKYGTTDKPRASEGQSANPRYIPARVRREVARRDEHRCTFVAEGGRRCEARGRLEFDHIEPVARGGRSTISNLRLRCRAHNQYAAERTYGPGFMSAKREGRGPSPGRAAPA